jgi:hypothetical protein
MNNKPARIPGINQLPSLVGVKSGISPYSRMIFLILVNFIIAEKFV